MRFTNEEIKLLIDGLDYYIGDIKAFGIGNTEQYLQWELNKKRPRKKDVERLQYQLDNYLKELNKVEQLKEKLKQYIKED